ncbi:MAG: RHS repeat protein, partial [Clostridiaceae bacterium]|nr:RHS repeat protein [Clostridiaceae bacterium]
DSSTETVGTDGVRTITKKDGTVETIIPEKTETDEKDKNIKTYYYSDDTQQCIVLNEDASGITSGINLTVDTDSVSGGVQADMPEVRSGDSLGIDCLMPGESIIGTYIGTPVVVGEHNPDEAYFRLSKAFSTTSGGSNTEIPVTITTIPSHINKFKVEVIDNRSIFADPVDTNTGGHLINYEALSVNGVTALSLDLDYNSRLIADTQQIKSSNNGQSFNAVRELGKSTIGKGWSHNYETWLTENKDGSITVYWSPYNYSTFYKGDGSSRIIYGMPDKYGNITLTGNVPKGEAEFYSKSLSMKNYLLNRNADGTYKLTCANGSKYFFDTNGQLVKMEDENGNYITLMRTEEGKLTITEPASKQTITLKYNKKGFVESVEDRTGRITFFKYDENANLISIIDSDGKTAGFTYDDKGLVLSGTDGDNTKYFENTYDQKGRVLTQDDGVEGNELTTFNYDEESEFWRTITIVKDRTGKTSKLVHNRSGQLIRAEDELGNKTYYTYDASGNRTSITDPKGNTTIFTYDENKNLITVSDAEGTKNVYTYDKRGNVLTETDSAGRKIVNTYTDNNLLETSTDQSGIKTTYTYNEYGKVLTKEVEGLGSTSYTYENGLMKTATDYKGNKYIYEYDSLGRRTAVTDREGNKTTVTYGKSGSVSAQTDPMGNTVKYTYDSRGHLLSETNAKGDTTTFKYNGNGNLTEVTDPEGNKTYFEYDGEDRQIKVIDHEGFASETVFDAGGRAVSTKDALGNITVFKYDVNGLLLSETAPGGGTVRYDYYRNGEVKSVTDEVYSTTTYK